MLEFYTRSCNSFMRMIFLSHGTVVLQVEKIVLFLIERQGLLAEQLQRLRKQRGVASQDGYANEYEDDESGLGELPSSPAVVPWLNLMDEYR